ncbi:PckG [Desulforapulum autotrophicum HRM2]|uniref:phosphoenolpyruvate carboxykinase (GTP) n=1 Tax=Desulforapulum autotrophicum (strain ATCC 43914 / DSM 3382 / VKM B-1955 / HRM2) TaxID=177437 RepID=C0QCF6_DESAH|nr:phosphoenolpyruvate carboxykinase (GTP) [Desulforapulum autotrophicum]ACN17173.1 PckG [Desulforapulum autotrophicum HRM2]
MANKKVGCDISCELGKVDSSEKIDAIFSRYMDDKNLLKIALQTNFDVRKKIANAIAICKPKAAFINTGTPEDRAFIRKLALEKGEESPLAMANHTIHFDLEQEQGRILDRTFYIVDEWEDVSSLAKRMDRKTALADVGSNMDGIMADMTMIVGFYMRGPVGAPMANPALEITSSAYVAHSAEILYRNAFNDFNKEVDRLGYFFTNIHSEGLNRAEDLPQARVFMDRSYLTTYAYKCTYAGNTLMLKKGNHRFAVDKAVYKNRGFEMSEHMFITGINGPGNRITWCAGAAPSGCGKTTTAMAGNHFVGDDLAQMWIAPDGTIRSINPECGIFGIVEDVNWDGDPMLMENLRKPGTEVIWSNVLVDDQGIPHWEGNGEEPPVSGTNFQGPWYQGMTNDNGKPVPISHPNSRCTLASTALANYCPEAENPAGVETRIFTYSGRDSDTMPPVWVAKDSDAGVVIGACIVSAATATEVGAKGVKRAPWANAPFIPGALGDYMAAQFDFFGNPAIAGNKQPIMAGLNYFLTDEARGGTTKKLLGEKRDVKVWLAWLERYAHNEVEFVPTPLGNLPCYEDLKRLFWDLLEKEYSEELYQRQFTLSIDNIIARIDLQVEAYAKEKNIPERLFEILAEQRQGLLDMK